VTTLDDGWQPVRLHDTRPRSTGWSDPAEQLDELLASLPGRPAWHAEAACRGQDPNLFFPGRGPTTLDRARALCAVCPVISECLDAGMAETVGLWAGLSPTERRRLRRDRRGEG
jgi:WhiB family redox-sensing transcriptional regulator